MRVTSLSSRSPRLEPLERRILWAVAAPPMLAPPAPLLDPFTIPQFQNDITNINPIGVNPANGEKFHFAPDADTTNQYTIGAYETSQNLLGDGLPDTPVFGYGYASDPTTATYPARTLEVWRDQPIAVTWVNGLPTKHLVNIDPTLMDMGMEGMGITYDPSTNEIPQGIPMVPHLHGGHTDAIYDGTPMQWWTASGAMGEDYTDTTDYNDDQPENTFTYRNDQQSGTLWYHDHAMGVTRLNAYAGMAGFYIIRDEWDSGATDNPVTPAYDGNKLRLPAGPYEMGLALQDKQFLSDGRMWFPAMARTVEGVDVASTLPEMFGDTILVNGKAWPNMDVEARRYRFRLLNASDSRFYTINVAGAPGSTQSALPIWQIGTDVGLLSTPVKGPTLVIAPGERADLIIDFTKIKPGTKLYLNNSAKAPFPNGARVVPGLTDRIMSFTVKAPDAANPDTSLPPAQLTNLNKTDPVVKPSVVAPTRQMALYETLDEFGRVTPLLGTPKSSYEFGDPTVIDGDINTQLVTYNPEGTEEVWEIFNNTADTHPIHLHQTQYQVLTRQAFTTKLVNLGLSPSQHTTVWGMAAGSTRYVGSPALTAGADRGWKDTIQIAPGEVITLRAKFDLPGKYVTHCHILSHEEHDMMRYMQVGNEDFPGPGMIVDDDGDVVSNPPKTSGMVGSFFADEPIGRLATDDQESVIDSILV